MRKIIIFWLGVLVLVFNLPNLSYGQETSKPPRKKPVVSFILSYYTVGFGAGQFYNGETGKGVTVALTSLGGLGLMAAFWGSEDYSEISGVGGMVFLGSWIYSMIDAPVSACRINKKNGYALLRIEPIAKKNYAGLRLAKNF